MAIPKIIHQTFRSKNLPFLTRWHISRIKGNNPEYEYKFYDDQDIIKFITAEYDQDVLNQYLRLQIGASKADFFRYLVLFKEGGVYLDIDSAIKGKLSNFILDSDSAIISNERNPGLFVQWALIFSPNHPFLKKTIELIMENIRYNKYPNDVHKMTGPSVYTEAINASLKENPGIQYRLLGTDYNKHLKFKYPLSKLLYQKGEHWKKMQLTKTVLRQS